METLARLVGDVDTFLAESWERAPHLRRGADPEGFADLLSLDEVDRIVTTRSPRPPALRMVRDGQPLPRGQYTRTGTVGGRRLDDLADPGRVLTLFEEGATLVLQGLHRWHAPVGALRDGLEAELTHPVQVNAYLTPPTAAGLDVHHDTHDVFVLQVHGRKRWRVHDPAIEVPLPSQRWSAEEHEPGELRLDTTVEPGDLLYLPRGTPHAATTQTAASLHLTVGIRVVRWRDVLVRAAEEAAAHRDFRAALPPGFAAAPDALEAGLADRLAAFAAALRETDAGTRAAAEVERFWSSRPPALQGQLHEVLALDAIKDDTTVHRRPHVSAHLPPADPDGDRITLVLGDRRLELPAAARRAVARVLELGELRPADLADLLDRDGRVVLVRRLVREGLLTTAGAR